MNRLAAIISILAAMLLAAAAAYPQSAKDKALLTTMLNEFLDGAGRSDAAVHERFWAEDLIYTRASGQRTNKTEILRSVRSAPSPKPGDPKTAYSAEEVRIQLYGNAAVVAFRLVGTTTRPDGSVQIQKYFNTGTFIKRKGRWQAVAWQATFIPQT